MSVNTTRQWALAGKKAKARARAVRGAVREAVTSAAVRGIGDIRFASPCARDLALAARFTWATFDGLIPSSIRGFTIADVRAILAFGGTDNG